ncbi:hypothetical protein QU926_18310 [Pseudomonas asiatica]|uniref:hypothetical protein n=1 Tax=Pseudomonas asiatica TaxID=2219225 RepID=UPI0025AA66BC|nr:hypothetical protein [Pseudomonas asiatica]MDM9555578.1 hypothetical protein [Pseudomonas asiatica]
MSYDFKGNNEALASSIRALLALDAQGALAPHGIGEMARQLLEASSARLAEQNQGELERLREHVSAYEASRARLHEWLRQEQLKNIALRAQLTEQVALLRDMHDSPYHYIRDFKPRIDATLSASAEPSAEKCETCKGNGVIGWRRGQTAESYEEGESPCEDCNSTGYAHSNGMTVSGVCTTCNGLGTVPDGEISGLDGVEFANGPVECIKNCPDCATAPPVGHDDAIREALRAFVGAAYPVASQINERGHNWSEAYLDEALALARAALERKPSSLVAQLQADLTVRDQQIDALRQGMKGDYDLDAWLAFVEEAPQLRLDAERYRWLRSRDLETISKGGVFAGLTPDNLVLNEETLDQAIDAAMAPDFVEASTHGRLNGVTP